MKEVFLVYKTDTWHSYNSRDLIGVGTTKEAALKICKQKAREDGYTLRGWNLQFLTEKNQTQGYDGPGEFVIEPADTNKLL